MSRILTDERVRFASVTASLLALGVTATPSSAADQRLEPMFHWFDRDGDGALAGDELFNAEGGPPGLPGAEISLTTKDGHFPGETRDDLFARVDASGDGHVTLEEMAEAIHVDSWLDRSFLEADQDGDRGVSAAELAASLTERRAAAGEQRPALGVALMAEGLVSTHDRNGDGNIDAEDLRG